MTMYQTQLTAQIALRVAPHLADACEIVGGSTAGHVVLVCDHASNCLPARYGTLGLSAVQLERHIAYDIGAEAVTRALANRLGSPAVLSRHSRLLIDPNRGHDDPTLIMRISDGAVIPGNRLLDDQERAHRMSCFYTPYHDAIRGVIDQCLAVGRVPFLVSVHSFTPVWKGVLRPWHAAILWDSDPRLAMALLDGLRADGDLVVGDNEPYHGALLGDTMWQHGTQRGLAHAIIEIRQDLICDTAGQTEWADRLAELIAAFQSDAGLMSQLMRTPMAHET
jgi:predicted N-formylglutamate amidohydrolase